MIRRNLPVGLLPYLISPPSLQFPYKFPGILLVISPFYPVHSLECVTETPVLLLLDFITSNNVSSLFYDPCSPSLLSSRLLLTFTWTTFKGLFSAPPSSSVDRAKALNSPAGPMGFSFLYYLISSRYCSLIGAHFELIQQFKSTQRRRGLHEWMELAWG